MTLDPTARESNVRDSIIKYFVDNMGGTEKVQVLFDIKLASPNLRNKTVEQWISINIGSSYRRTMSELLLTINCCQRKDPENHKLSQLVDKTMNYLIDTSGDGIRRIPFYQSKPKGQSWVLIGGLLVHDIILSRDFTGEDGTSFKTITATLKWPTKM